MSACYQDFCPSTNLTDCNPATVVMQYAMVDTLPRVRYYFRITMIDRASDLCLHQSFQINALDHVVLHPRLAHEQHAKLSVGSLIRHMTNLLE